MQKRVNHPPRIATRLLDVIIQGENKQSILGDYEEMYQDLVEHRSLIVARSWYWSQVLKSLPLFLCNRVYGGLMMWKNYVKLAYRSLIKQGKYTFLNILGLAVGLASCLLITSYVIHELSYETMHPLKHRIYRINGNIPMGGRILKNGVVGAPLGPAAAASLPEVESCVRLHRYKDLPVRAADRDFKEDNLFFAEPGVFDMFSIPLIRGDAGTSLEAPFTVIIDETLARKYFGDANPIGQTLHITIGEPHDFQVTGLIKDMPSNTVLRRSMMISFATIIQIYGDEYLKWQSWGSTTTFVLLREGSDPGFVEEKLTELARTNLPEDEKDASYYLQPLRKIYIDLETKSHGLNNDLGPVGSISRITIFAVIALLILLIAVINFVNLSTARVTRRLKEVGVRKTFGAARPNLMKQFLAESILLSAVAMGLGLFLFQVFKPRLDQYLGKTLTLDLMATPWIVPVIIGLILVVGLLVGFYPAFFFSRFPAATAFRFGIPSGSSKAGLRRTLVIVQFFIAISIITSTTVVLKQVRFSENTDLGFVKDNLIIITNRSAYRLKNAGLIKREIQNQSQAVSVAAIGYFPHRQNRNISTFHPQDKREEKGIVAQTMDFDADFVSTMGLKLASGRNFEAERVADENAVLINRKAIEAFGLTDPVGSILYNDDDAYRVIGVLEDWHTNSIHSMINPTVVFRSDDTAGQFVVRLDPDRRAATIEEIREIWNRFLPQTTFDYTYVTDLLNRSYNGERRLAALLVSFCALTIFVACLGIFGLASYVTEQRTKEIGIRKVLGARVSGVILILSKQFVFWIVAANLLAWPITYFAMRNWLQRFAYRTRMEWWIFILAGFAVLMTALITVCLQSVRAARANPIEALRYE